MSDEALLRTIAEILGERLMVDPASITRATTAEDIDGWDSVTHTLIVMEVERRLGVTFEAGDIFDLHDVGDLVDLAARTRARA